MPARRGLSADRSELDTTPLIDALLLTGRQLFVPKVRTGQRMHLVELCPDSSLRVAAWHRRSGGHARRALRHRLDVILLPLVAFDRQGRRLGSGPLLRPPAGVATRLPAALAVGYAYAIQQHPQLPEDVWTGGSTR